MDVRGLARTMKQISKGTTNAGIPVNIVIGTVTKLNPLEVNVDQRFTLTADFLIVPESLTRYEIDLEHTHTYLDDNGTTTLSKITEEALPTIFVIREGLKVGDMVILVRVQGGQQYVVLDRVMV